MSAILQMPPQAAPRKVTTRSSISASQLQFDWLLGERQFWSLKSAAGLLGVSDSFLEKLWDAGQISGHEFNAGRNLRMTKRIPRAFLVALLVATARYSGEAKLQAVISTFREFGVTDLRTMRAAIDAEIARKERS